MTAPLARVLDANRLRTLLVFVETGSLSATASRLYVTPAAVHKQLQVLARELDLPLYEREGRELRIAEGARYLLPHIRNLLAQHDAVWTALEEWRGLEQRMIRIGTGRTFSSYLLPPLLQAFRVRHPGVEFYVETGHTPDLIESLHQRHLDVAFLVTSPLSRGPDLAVNARWEFDIVLVSGVRSYPRPCPTNELASEPFLLYPEGSIFAAAIEEYLLATGLEPNVTMRLDNPESIKEMARAGLGLAMLPYWTVAEELRTGALTLIEREGPPLRSRVELVTRRRSHAPPAVTSFIELARGWTWERRRLVREGEANGPE